MRAALDGAALAVTTAALIAAAVTLTATRPPRTALPVLLDLLTAAGLLRLAAEPDWHRLASATAVIGVRHLVLLGLGRTGPPARDRASSATSV